jgi:hypothetical protein
MFMQIILKQSRSTKRKMLHMVLCWLSFQIAYLVSKLSECMSQWLVQTVQKVHLHLPGRMHILRQAAAGLGLASNCGGGIGLVWFSLIFHLVWFGLWWQIGGLGCMHSSMVGWGEFWFGLQTISRLTWFHTSILLHSFWITCYRLVQK